jgi:hypothetical protein
MRRHDIQLLTEGNSTRMAFLTRLRSLAGVLCVSLLATLPTRALAADPQNGVLSGLAVTWNAANTLQLEPGEAYANGHQYAAAPPAAAFAFAAANMPAGGAPAPNTAYYVYLCWDTVAAAFTAHPVISTTAPTTDGLPSAAINNHNGKRCNALFVGSVVSDSLSNLVPFVRMGEEVILSLVNNVNNPCAAGATSMGAGQVPFSWTALSAVCQFLEFDSDSTTDADDVSCNGRDNLLNALNLPYPTSASAIIVDWWITVVDTAGHFLFVPLHTPNPGPAPGVALSNFQLNLFANLGQYYAHTRVNPWLVNAVNVGNTPAAPAQSAQFAICIDALPGGNNVVRGYVYYRGYVESIGHLTTSPQG